MALTRNEVVEGYFIEADNRLIEAARVAAAVAIVAETQPDVEFAENTAA